MTEPVLPSLLRSLYLTQMVKDHEPLADQAGREGWTFPTYLRRLCENEISTRARRRTERFLRESHLPDTKTMANLDQARLPAKTQRQLPALVEGDFVGRAENVLAFGLPGRGKTHLLCAVGIGYGSRPPCAWCNNSRSPSAI